MRDFTIRRGKYAGTHTIYDSEAEARLHRIIPKKPWHDKSVEVGDWVVSDDGYVIQLLHKFVLTNTRHRSGQYTDVFRFANGSFYAYYDKYGNKHLKNFYAVASANHKSSLGNTSALGKYMTLKKKHFVTLLTSGLDAYNAYKIAYKIKGKNTNHIWVQVNKLLSDPLVKKEVMENLKPFIAKIEEQVVEKTGKTLVDWLASELTTIMVDLRLPAKERRANIKLILDLFGEQMGLIAPKQKSKQIEDADYELVAPPLLGNRD